MTPDEWKPECARMFNLHNENYNRLWQRVLIQLPCLGVALDFNDATQMIWISPDPKYTHTPYSGSAKLAYFRLLRYHDFADTGTGLAFSQVCEYDEKGVPTFTNTCKFIDDPHDLVEAISVLDDSQDTYDKLVGFLTTFKEVKNEQLSTASKG